MRTSDQYVIIMFFYDLQFIKIEIAKMGIKRKMENIVNASSEALLDIACALER